MKEVSGIDFGINSSFRAFSSHGMAAAGIPHKSGQLELFALRVADKSTSDAAQPTLESGVGSHMTGMALDLAGGYDWVKSHGETYGFTNFPGEVWHFDFNPEVWKKNFGE